MPELPPLYSRDPASFLAPYASYYTKTRGRLHAEPSAEGRSTFQRDRDRIIHASAFRRLEYKTQVFVNHEGDHYRTRLTHSLEVAQLARTCSRELGLDEDLAEAVALSHDLGHPPFGHAGEHALSECMKTFGGFDHNIHALKMVTALESKYAEFDGLNLSWECLEGMVKHNGPLRPEKIDGYLATYLKKHDLEVSGHASLEAQVAALCDDVAYNNHDIEDGLRAGLFTEEQLVEVPLVGDIFKEVKRKYPNLEQSRLIHESKRRLINLMCGDMLEQTRRNIAESGVKTVEDVRGCGKTLATFSAAVEQGHQQLRAFLRQNMYRHYKVNRMTSKAERLVRELFEALHNEPGCLPTHWQKRADGAGTATTAEVVADFIAGMTDRFALEEHQKLFDLSYRVIGSR